MGRNLDKKIPYCVFKIKGQNGEVRFILDKFEDIFSLVPKVDDSHPKDKSSRYFGLISLKKALDFETETEYKFTVTAQNILPGLLIKHI